jgi:hypothetical protein
MDDIERVDRNYILSIASRIAQEQIVTESQARDFCKAVSGYFSRQLRNEETDKTLFKAIADATKGVVDVFGLPPGYIHKYESGIEEARRKENVRGDYRFAKENMGIVSKIDAIWE